MAEAPRESLILQREKRRLAEPAGDSTPTGTRYSVEKQVAEGGMGLIFQGHDHDLGRRLAIKTLREDWRDAESLERFVAEARSVGRLQHPNILPIHELALDDQGVPYYTMPLVEGETLAQVITKLRSGDVETHRAFTFARRLAIISQLCEALTFAHENGFVHRDLKPENVMIGPFGEVFLMDWGLAISPERLREEKQVVGTPGFIAPEILRGEPAGTQSDIYSLGALMYEFFTLKEAHPGKTPEEKIQNTLKKTPWHPWMVRAPGQGQTPREISQMILQRLLRKDPAQRIQTTAEVRGLIARYLDGQAPVTCPCTGMKRATNVFLRVIDRFGLVAVFFACLWLVAPIFLGALLWAR